MSAIRNFVLGVLVGVALVVPTTLSAPGENALELFASARSEVEARVATSARATAAGVAQWVARQLSDR
ncbi:MAG TPA: hypothetical protein VG889_15735 [Rhizomicrobium sp.]|nr:hypothetical protein [Rhizomicrobium sp.]